MLDDIDRAILELLQEDARIANAEIARRVDLAPSAVFQRIRKLEDRGVIQGYHARLDPRALGHGLMAFVMLRTGEGARGPVVRKKLAGIPEIVEVHRVVGEDCFFIKVRVADTDTLGRLLDDEIQAIPDVASTRTTIVVQTEKETFAVPIPSLKTA